MKFFESSLSPRGASVHPARAQRGEKGGRGITEFVGNISRFAPLSEWRNGNDANFYPRRIAAGVCSACAATEYVTICLSAKETDIFELAYNEQRRKPRTSTFFRPLGISFYFDLLNFILFIFYSILYYLFFLKISRDVGFIFSIESISCRTSNRSISEITATKKKEEGKKER